MRKGLLWLLAICGWWFATDLAQAVEDNWTDRSPHQEALIQANGIKLSYLDWGGAGEPMLFLAGLGDTAHIFDDLAPKFTKHFHVLGLTRRGYGESEKPATGYTTDILVEDIHEFLDALKIKRVVLVGHSIAGNELTLFAKRFPERVGKLVYLDAAYDRSGLADILAKSPPEPRPSPEDNRTLGNQIRWCKKVRPVWSEACEAAWRDTRVAKADGSGVEELTPNQVVLEVLQGTLDFHPDYAKVIAPALGIFALDDEALPRWKLRMPEANEAARKRAEEFQRLWRARQRQQIERFSREVIHAKVVEMPGTVHRCFIQRPSEVVRAMESFLNSN